VAEPLSRPDVDPPTGPAPDDVVIEDLVVGEGPEAKAGDLVSAHYVGVTHDGGETFDASWDRGDPLEFRLGVGMVIWGTLLQRRVPPALLGRVSSLDFFVSLSFMPLSMALAGTVSEVIGLTTTFLLAALVPSVLAVVAIVGARMTTVEIAHPLDTAASAEPVDDAPASRDPEDELV